MSDPHYEMYVDEEGKARARRRDGQEVCDFCMTPNPTWVYPAGEMEISSHPVIDMSDDDWGACDTCHDLLEANNTEDLITHMIQTQRRLYPPSLRTGVVYPPDFVLRKRLRDHLQRFTRARTGPAWKET